MLSASLGLSLFAFSAWAYIPPAKFILHMLAEKHLDISSVQVRSTVAALDDQGKPTSTMFQETTIFVPSTETLRSWASDEKGNVLFTEERTGPNVPLAAEILFADNSSQMMSAIQAVGMDLPPSASPAADGAQAAAVPDLGAEKMEDPNLSLHRWNRTFAWVIGDAARKDASFMPQLWMEKDSFIPLRLIAPATGENVDSSSYYDLQWENDQNFGEFSYPKTAMLYQAGKNQALLRAELVDVKLRSSTKFTKPIATGFTDAGNAASSDVRDLIQTYYRFIR